MLKNNLRLFASRNESNLLSEPVLIKQQSTFGNLGEPTQYIIGADSVQVSFPPSLCEESLCKLCKK